MLFGKKLSIIIPVHNGADYLANALSSASAQTLPSLEILCIDDGSDDRSPEVLREYGKIDRRLRVISLAENRGTFYARNVGIGYARGKYLLFLDCDDRLGRHIGERCVRLSEEWKLDVVAFRMRLVEGDRETDCDFANLSPSDNEIYDRPLDLFLCKKIRHMMRNRLYRADPCRRALKLLGQDFCRLRLTHSEDLAFTVAVLACAETHCSIPSDGYFYCRREDSASAAFRRDREKIRGAIADHCRVIRRLSEILPSSRLNDLTAATERLFLFFLEGVLPFPPDEMSALADGLISAYDPSQSETLRETFFRTFPRAYSEKYRPGS